MTLRAQLTASIELDAAQERIEWISNLQNDLQARLDHARHNLVIDDDSLAPTDLIKCDWESFNRLLTAAVDIYFAPLMEEALRQAAEAERVVEEFMPDRLRSVQS